MIDRTHSPERLVIVFYNENIFSLDSLLEMKTENLVFLRRKRNAMFEILEDLVFPLDRGKVPPAEASS